MTWDTVQEEMVETNSPEMSKGLSRQENALKWEEGLDFSSMIGVAEEDLPPAAPSFVETLRKRLREEEEEEEENAVELPPISIPRMGG